MNSRNRARSPDLHFCMFVGVWMVWSVLVGTGASFSKCAECKDRDYCSVCMCRNFNETGDMFKPAEHFCKVAAINHEIVDEKQRQMLAAAKEE